MGALSNLPFLRGWGPRDPNSVDYRPATDQELEPAIRLVLTSPAGPPGEAQVREFVRLMAVHRNDAGGPMLALQAGRLVSALLPMASPGRTMLLFVPGLLLSELQEQATRRLVEITCAQAARNGIHLAQVLLDLHDDRVLSLLGSCGFRQLAELLYLQSSVAPSLPPPKLPPGHRWLHYSPAVHDRFARAILATYQNSLDCPGLNGLRDIEDIVAGHRATGEFNPDMWSLFCHGDESLGVLLLSRVPRSNMMELVYLGLPPQSRGRGFGDLLVRHAFALTSASDCEHLTLAVDAKNTPALQLYWRHGLRTVGRKLAILRDLRT